MKRDRDPRILLAHRKAHYKNLETLEPEKRVKAPSKPLMYQQEI
mgnify:FL=1